MFLCARVAASLSLPRVAAQRVSVRSLSQLSPPPSSSSSSPDSLPDSPPHLVTHTVNEPLPPDSERVEDSPPYPSTWVDMRPGELVAVEVERNDEGDLVGTWQGEEVVFPDLENTLEWVLSTPVEAHLFEEVPIIKECPEEEFDSDYDSEDADNTAHTHAQAAASTQHSQQHTSNTTTTTTPTPNPTSTHG